MLKAQHFETSEEEVSLEKQGGTIEERIDTLLELSNVNAKGFNPINFRAAIDHVVDKKQKEKAQGLMDLLTGDMEKTLEASVTKGPLEDSDVPSKDARNDLVKLELMAIVFGGGGETKLSGATELAVSLRKVAGVKDEDSDD